MKFGIKVLYETYRISMSFVNTSSVAVTYYLGPEKFLLVLSYFL